MRTVELAGSVGAGKSTLAPVLIRTLRDAGIDALSLADAVAEAAGGRVRARVDIPSGIAFVVSNASLMRLAWNQLRRADIDRSHRRRIMGLVLRLGARLRFVAARLPDDRVVVAEEGFVQRMVNVFAWLPDGAPAGAMERYLELAPVADTVVLVRVEPSLAAARARERGLPTRVRTKRPMEAEAFMARAGEVVDRAAAILAARGVRVIEIDNTGPPDSVAETLRDAVRGKWPVPASAPPPTVKLGPLALPRPRRGRSGAVRPSDVAALGSALHGLGIDAWRLVRPLGRQAGRSGSVLVDTQDGYLVVKRYKATVEADQVRVEHAILLELERRAFPAPRLLEAPDGNTVIEAGGSTFAVFRHVDGYRRADDVVTAPWTAVRRSRLYGASLGALHAAIHGFVPPPGSPHGFASVGGPRARDLDWHLELLERVERVAGIDSEVRDAVSEVRRELPRLESSLAAVTLPRNVIHGDYGPYNLLVRDGAPVLIVDYELARFDWRIVDLATGLPRFGIGGSRGPQRAMDAFLEGYGSRAAVSASELGAIPRVLAFLSLRRCAVCLARVSDGGPAMQAEAMGKLQLARTILEGTHPIQSVTGYA